MEKHSSVSWNT